MSEVPDIHVCVPLSSLDAADELIAKLDAVGLDAFPVVYGTTDEKEGWRLRQDYTARLLTVSRANAA